MVQPKQACNKQASEIEARLVHVHSFYRRFSTAGACQMPCRRNTTRDTPRYFHDASDSHTRTVTDASCIFSRNTELVMIQRVYRACPLSLNHSSTFLGAIISGFNSLNTRRQVRQLSFYSKAPFASRPLLDDTSLDNRYNSSGKAARSLFFLPPPAPLHGATRAAAMAAFSSASL